MVLKFEQIFDNIIVSGDIHEDIIPLIFKLQNQKKIENSIIIVAGDIGIGFNKDGYYIHLLKKASQRLRKNNNTLLLVRGNHDNPDKWLDYEPFKEFWQDGNSNIRLIKDYTVIEAKTERKEHRILCVGGAISIDRKPNENVFSATGKPWPGRNEGKDYWPNEAFVYDESKIKDLTGITDVITHSAPDFCQPIIKKGIEKWFLSDKDLEKDCNKEREDHTLLFNKLSEKNKIKTWCYGHMHYNHTDNINNVLFVLLGVSELYEL